jgi:hypothetical protein
MEREGTELTRALSDFNPHLDQFILHRKLGGCRAALVRLSEIDFEGGRLSSEGKTDSLPSALPLSSLSSTIVDLSPSLKISRTQAPSERCSLFADMILLTDKSGPLPPPRSFQATNPALRARSALQGFWGMGQSNMLSGKVYFPGVRTELEGLNHDSSSQRRQVASPLLSLPASRRRSPPIPR